MELISLPDLLRFVAALVFVLALMGGLSLVMRRINAGTRARIGKRRLGIVESLPLDARNRLVIVQCDKREHLLIIGANGQRVIETMPESRQDSANTPQE